MKPLRSRRLGESAKRSVQTRNNAHREDAKIHIFAALDRDQLAIRNPARPQKIGCALRSNDDCTGFLRDIGRIHHVVGVGVSDQNEIRTRDVGIDDGAVGCKQIVVGRDRTRVVRGDIGIRNPAFDAREVRID